MIKWAIYFCFEISINTFLFSLVQLIGLSLTTVAYDDTATI